MSKIPWTEKTWNPIVGCTKCSPGCLNCYAEMMANRLACMGQQKYLQAIEYRNRKGQWNGKIFCDEKALDKPLHWRKPRKIFVCSMSDLFHKKVPFEFIDRVMVTGALCPQHTLQILTKRDKRMCEYFTADYRSRVGKLCAQYVKKSFPDCVGYWPEPFLKNLHLGVSISTPEELHKAETLKQIPVAKKFISLEPLLADMGLLNLKGIDQVIIGAESKGSHPGRECKLDWVKSLVDQCTAAGVAVFVKQLHIDGKLVKDIKKFPVWARKQQYPKGGKL